MQFETPWPDIVLSKIVKNPKFWAPFPFSTVVMRLVGGVGDDEAEAAVEAGLSSSL